MSKRPWDRCNKGRGQTLPSPAIPDNNSTSSIDNDSNNPNNHTPTCQVPSITVEGIQYYSDRFYLHRTLFDPPPSQQHDCQNSIPNNCTCKVPPLLDRIQLIHSLDLKAAIFATYTLNLRWMARVFPQLCGPDATVPTLVLHGQKGLASKIKESRQKASSAKTNGDSSSDEEDDDFDTTTTSSDHTMAPEEGWQTLPQTQEEDEDTALPFQYDKLGPQFHLTQVLPRWLPRSKQTSPTAYSSSSQEEQQRQQPPPQTEGRLGVHHPKYMILFCKDGSVVVLVSTGNLTCPRATDATWMQRFEPAPSTGKVKVPKSHQRRNGSDFGAVLADFLQCQSHAAEKRGVTPNAFLETYMNFGSLTEFEQSYRFYKAQVHLIATVPGDFEGRFVREHLKRDGEFLDFLYGRQRVADIVARLSQKVEDKRWKDGEWFPDTLLSKYDRLILQPTSIGAHWTLSNLSGVVRSYLGHDDKTKSKWSASSVVHNNKLSSTSSTKRQKGTKNKYSDSKYCGDDQKLLERLDIVWPSMRLMHAIVKSRSASRRITNKSPRSVMVELDAGAGVVVGTTTTTDETLNNDINDEKMDANEASNSTGATGSSEEPVSSFCFLSSKSFNSIQPTCLSQMVMFEPSVPEQRQPLTPHIKSVARLFEGDERALKLDYGVGKAENYFPWYLLTSACLSHGAQGKAKEGEGCGDNADTLSYANFELGVMFCSRLQGNRNESNRLYCWKPARCTCSYPTSDISGATLIHLPVPFSCHSTPFQLHSEETRFVETPYMHEIEPGTKVVGNMKDTPLGAAAIASMATKE